jgi:hypothetical protein
MAVIHIPFTQLNVTSIDLGYYMILKCGLKFTTAACEQAKKH